MLKGAGGPQGASSGLRGCGPLLYKGSEVLILGCCDGKRTQAWISHVPLLLFPPLPTVP